MKEWDGNISRLKPYLVDLEARLAAVEGRLPDPKEQAKPDPKASPDPQKVAAEALSKFVDVTDKPAAPPKGKA